MEAGIPYDESKGIIPNVGGKVNDEEGDLWLICIFERQITLHIIIMLGLYCAGWLATGPRGVIVDTMNEAYKVGQTIINDWSTRETHSREKPGHREVAIFLHIVPFFFFF